MISRHIFFWAQILLLIGFDKGIASSNVLNFFHAKDVLEWKSEMGLAIYQAGTKTQISDHAGFEWTLSFPFRVDGAVELKSRSELILRIVRWRGDGFDYAFLVKIAKRSDGLEVVAPVHAQEFMKARDEWIDSISVPLAERDTLIVLLAKFGEWSGGQRSVHREWRYWDFETGQLGEVFRGEVQPSKFIE